MHQKLLKHPQNKPITNTPIAKNTPEHILIVADSHSRNLDLKVLENSNKTKVDMAIANTVDEDIDAKYRNKNS